MGCGRNCFSTSLVAVAASVVVAVVAAAAVAAAVASVPVTVLARIAWRVVGAIVKRVRAQQAQLARIGTTGPACAVPTYSRKYPCAVCL
jgi:hypothetical protein